MEPSPPTPVVLLLADGCELIERGCPSATRVLPRVRSYRTTCTKTTDVEWLFQHLWLALSTLVVAILTDSTVS